MAVQVSKKIYRAFIVVNLLIILFSAQVSDSIKMKACIKNCIINQCMRGSEKATPAKCYIPCKIMCDPKKDGQEIADPNVYRNPVVRFCLNFGWIFGKNEKESEKKAILVTFPPENIRSSGDDDSSSGDDNSSSGDDDSSSRDDDSNSGDSKTLVAEIVEGSNFSDLHGILSDIRTLAEAFTSVSFHWVPRNSVFSLDL
uniref:RNase H type-1 domain-containing protein n=1 Tax=Brassica oleracea var. oleracea TaxID=109376 RepID=A0A0D3DSK5_BRAOL